MPELAYIALGSNLGDRLANLNAALTYLRKLGQLTACSSLYETEPREFTAQPWFLNAAVALATAMKPQDLLRELLHIESRMGRIRADDPLVKGPRLIDLDLLFFSDTTVDQLGLHLPHPRIPERLFVLTPLAEIAPDLVHPLLRCTIRDLHMSRASDANSGTVRLFAPALCWP